MPSVDGALKERHQVALARSLLAPMHGRHRPGDRAPECAWREPRDRARSYARAATSRNIGRPRSSASSGISAI